MKHKQNCCSMLGNEWANVGYWWIYSRKESNIERHQLLPFPFWFASETVSLHFLSMSTSPMYRHSVVIQPLFNLYSWELVFLIQTTCPVCGHWTASSFMSVSYTDFKRKRRERERRTVIARNRTQFGYLVTCLECLASHPQIAFHLRMTFKITFCPSSFQFPLNLNNGGKLPSMLPFSKISRDCYDPNRVT